MSELWTLAAREIADGIRQRQFSSTEVTRALLERIDAYDRRLCAFITVDAERALADARDADQTVPTGSLHGVPIAVKDNIDTADLRTTGGSRMFKRRVPDADAPVVASLKAQGAIVLGKTNLHEFAYGGTCTNVEFGAVRNPWNLDHVPGGSSGGSGAAVAASLAPAALGTDTAGSVRLPAAQCGIVGLKPTYGRTSIERVIPLAWSLDHVGPMARSVADVALLYAGLANQPIAVPQGDSLRGVRIGVVRNFFFEGLQPDISAATETAIDVLRDLGADVRDVEWPGVEVSNSATWTIILAEASAYHRPWFRTAPELYSDETRANLAIGEFLPAGDYVQAQRARTTVQRSATHLMRELDVVVTPSLPITAPRIGQATVAVDGKVKPVNPVFIRLACPFNLTGMPAISLPCGFGDSGLPIGLQIAASPLQEQLVLRVGAAYEAATDWHARRPALDSVAAL